METSEETNSVVQTETQLSDEQLEFLDGISIIFAEFNDAAGGDGCPAVIRLLLFRHRPEGGTLLVEAPAKVAPIEEFVIGVVDDMFGRGENSGGFTEMHIREGRLSCVLRLYFFEDDPDDYEEVKEHWEPASVVSSVVLENVLARCPLRNQAGN